MDRRPLKRISTVAAAVLLMGLTTAAKAGFAEIGPGLANGSPTTMPVDVKDPPLTFDTSQTNRNLPYTTTNAPDEVRTTVAAPMPPAVVSGAVILAGNVLLGKLLKKRLR